jgi:hypothetical protein
MRFGKTFTTYQLAKKLGASKVLVVTFKPAVEDAWRTDLESHADFNGWQYMSKNTPDKDPRKADKKRPLVYFGSFQDLLGKDKNGNIKARNEWVHTTNWDLPNALSAGLHWGQRVHWMGKSSLFKWPFGGFMRWLGGVSVDRSKSTNAVQQMVEWFGTQDRLVLVIAPALAAWAAFPFTDTLVLANMNASRNNAGERSPVVAYRVDYSRGEFQGFGFAGVHGKVANLADPAGAKSRADLFEFDAYFIRGDWTVQGQLSYGAQKGAAIVPDPVTGGLRDSRWTGLSALAAYKFTPRFEGIARLDYIRNAKNGGGLLGYTGYWDPINSSHGDNRNGIGVDPTIDCITDATIAACNTGANRMAFSLGLSYLWDMSTTLKVEYRLDHANLPVFANPDATAFRKSNSLLGASVVVTF